MVFSLIALIQRIRTVANPPAAVPVPDSKPIKFGILGAANIAPDALIKPAYNHGEAVVYAVAARDKDRATAYAKKHGIEKVYSGSSGYQDLLDDPEVEAVYNPLPNALHYEWTIKALNAGKHVLLEKPAADTAEETRQMFELAESKGLVILEAFHYRFHPAIQRVKAILNSGELGAIKSITTKLMLPAGMMKPDDIRFKFSLGGGAMMDVGCYTLSSMRYLAGANPTSIISATPTLYIPAGSPVSFKADIDRATTATLAFPNDITGTLYCDLSIPATLGFIPVFPKLSATVECEGGSVDLFNFVMPTLYHTITVTTKDKGGKKKTRTEKVYTFADGEAKGRGEDWWTTYRHQLEAFVDRVKGREPRTWVEKEDSVANMEWVEKIYEKGGLGIRPKSTYVAPQ